MDSKNIFIKSNRLLQHVEWLPDYLSAWMYSGVKDDFKKDFVFEHVNSFLTGDAFYLVVDRNNSHQLAKQELQRTISDLIGSSFFIWDTSFWNVMEFNRIGTFRKGKYSEV